MTQLTLYQSVNQSEEKWLPINQLPLDAVNSYETFATPQQTSEFAKEK